MQANLLAAACDGDEGRGQVYNVAVGERTSLNELFFAIRDIVAESHPAAKDAQPVHKDFRAGDVRHSLADVSKAADLIGYAPTMRVGDGLRTAAQWYLDNLTAKP